MTIKQKLDSIIEDAYWYEPSSFQDVSNKTDKNLKDIKEILLDYSIFLTGNKNTVALNTFLEQDYKETNI